MTDGPPSLRFCLPASPARLHVARERIRDYLSYHCADREGIDDVILCLEEAWTNAIRHSGSAQDIEVSLGFVGDDLAVRVRDRGCGFDVATFNPHELPDPLQMSGRGLYIMSELMDELRLKCKDGLEVSMVKRGMRAPVRQPLVPKGVPFVAAAHGHTSLARDERVGAEEIDDDFSSLDWECL